MRYPDATSNNTCYVSYNLVEGNLDGVTLTVENVYQ